MSDFMLSKAQKGSGIAQSLQPANHSVWHSHNGGTLCEENIGKTAGIGHKTSAPAFA
jgi:hypothetical protein